METSKIQAVCGLTDAQWDTELPGLYPRMLEEGRTMARVKAQLDDVFRPDNLFSLNAVHLRVTTDLAKDEVIRQRKQTLIRMLVAKIFVELTDTTKSETKF